MPEWLIGIPQWGLALGLLVSVFLIVLVLSLLVLSVGSAFRRTEPADGPSLADSAEPLLRARRGFSRLDAQFDRLAQGTQLGIDGETAIGWILLVSAIIAALCYLLMMDAYSFEDSILVGIFAAVLGGLAVFAFFYALRNRRRRAIQEQLPDGCFQLARSLRSGLVLASALRETSHYLPQPLAGLFAKLSAALSLGESTSAALRRAAADAELTEFDVFAEVLILNSESGGNLPAMLDRLASSMRDRNQYRGYFRSVTTTARIGALFLWLVPPVVFLAYWLGIIPEQKIQFDKFLRASLGHTILVAAFVLWILGGLWILYLVRRQDDY
jgi:Flp pilus assembly protein TadB